MAYNADGYSFVLMFINPAVLMKVLFFQHILLINVERAIKSVYSGVHKNCYSLK
jgi:hypothetical protein